MRCVDFCTGALENHMMVVKITVILTVFVLILALNMSGGRDEPFTSFPFRLYIIPVALTAYLGGMKIACLVLFAALLQGVVTTFAAEYRILQNILFLLFSGGIFFLTCKIGVGFKKRFAEIKKSYDEKHRKVKESYEGLTAEDKKLVANNRILEEKVLTLKRF